MRTEVVVVGGGPAGAAAAIALVDAKREVILVDKAAFPRDKFCGDGLTTAALRLYESLGLDPTDVPSWRAIDEFAIRSPSGRWVELHLPMGRGQYAAVARRSELDAALLDVARSRGVKVLDGHAVEAVEDQADRIVVHASGTGPIEGRYLIGADGMWSPTRKMLGVAEPRYLGEWHAFRQYYRDVAAPARDRLVVWFEPDMLPGYAWSFPVGDGGANVGFGIWRDGGLPTSAMRGLWADLLQRSHVREILGDRAVAEGPHRAWPIPARIDRSVLSRGRALWVGDAAAAADPMTGEGIAQALETGIWAAEAVLAAGALDSAGARRHYEQAVRQGLVADHRMSMLLLRALRHRTGNRIPLWLVDRNEWTRRNFARWLWEDYPRALIVTPRRWHRRMFTGPGAYR